MGSTTLEPLTLAQAAINRGDLAYAARILYLMGQSGKSAEYRDNAHFWFAYSLVARLVGGDDSADICRGRAESCANYDVDMGADFDRDEALALIRRGTNLERAYKLLKPQLEHPDPNRRGAAHMAMARYYYASGRYLASDVKHAEADALWSSLPEGEVDIQWIKNNDFHWMKTLAQRYFGRGSTKRLKAHLSPELYGLCHLVIGFDPDPRRRKLARLILKGRLVGLLAVKLYDTQASR